MDQTFKAFTLNYDKCAKFLQTQCTVTKGDFAITNVDGKTTFSFQIPSTETIDFVKNHSSNRLS